MAIVEMNKRQLSLLLALVLFISSFSNTFHSAYATAVNTDFALPAGKTQTFYMNSIEKTIAIYTGTGQNANNATANFFVIDGQHQTANPTVISATIKPHKGGCDPLSNPCNSNGGSANCNITGSTCQADTSSSHYFKLSGLWCGLADCYVQVVSISGGYSSQLVRVTAGLASPAVSGYLNISSSAVLAPALWGVDIGTSGIGGVTIFRADDPNSSGIYTMYKIGGTSLMGTVLSWSTSQGLTAGSISGCWFCHDDTTLHRVAIASGQSNGANRDFSVWNADNGALICSTIVSAHGSSTNVGGLVTYSGDYGTSNTSGDWIFSSDTFIYKLNFSTCGITTQTAYATLGLSNYVKGFGIEKVYATTAYTGKERMHEPVVYVYHGSTQSSASVTKMNYTSFNTPLNFDSVTGNTISGYVNAQLLNSITADPYAHTLILTSGTSTKARLVYLDNFIEQEGSSGGTGGEVCFTVEGTGQHICYPTDSNGNPIVGSALEVVTNQNPPALAVGKLLCQTGIQTDCTNGHPTDTDPSTNGAGYILFFGVLAVAMAVVGVALYGRVKVEYNLMLQVAILLISAGFAQTIGWISPVIFYTLIFLIIAFASVGITKFAIGKAGRGGGGGESG